MILFFNIIIIGFVASMGLSMFLYVLIKFGGIIKLNKIYNLIYLVFFMFSKLFFAALFIALFSDLFLSNMSEDKSTVLQLYFYILSVGLLFVGSKSIITRMTIKSLQNSIIKDQNIEDARYIANTLVRGLFYISFVFITVVYYYIELLPSSEILIFIKPIMNGLLTVVLIDQLIINSKKYGTLLFANIQDYIVNGQIK